MPPHPRRRFAAAYPATRFRARKHRLAGRSARRRMNHGNQKAALEHTEVMPGHGIGFWRVNDVLAETREHRTEAVFLKSARGGLGREGPSGRSFPPPPIGQRDCSGSLPGLTRVLCLSWVAHVHKVLSFETCPEHNMRQS